MKYFFLGRRLLEVAAWFHISVHTALRKNCWHWLADLLFKHCLKVLKILRTGVKREASIRFTYAQFLSEKRQYSLFLFVELIDFVC